MSSTKTKSAGISPFDPRGVGHQRSTGDLRVSVRLRGSKTVLADLRQEGCLKARFPRPVDLTEIVTLNTSGGVAGGDRLTTSIAVGAGASVTFASQAAERFYRALSDDAPARVRTAIRIEPGAAAEWLPQESILFDRCALDRVLDVELAADGWFLGVESLVFGRAAMGETVRAARLRDVIRIRRAGRLLLHDAIRIEGDVNSLMARPATAGGAHAIATIIHVAPDAAGYLDAVRDVLPDGAGASAWNGMLVARIVADDGACLRAAVVAGLERLRAGRTLPRVWMC